jgi:hypothetical protein
MFAAAAAELCLHSSITAGSSKPKNLYELLRACEVE